MEHESFNSIKDAIKALILGEYANTDVERAFRELYEDGLIPNDDETTKAMSVFQRLPFFFEHWRKLDEKV